MSRGLSFGVLVVLFALVAVMAHRVNAPYRPPEPPKPPPVTETSKDGMTAPPGLSGEKKALENPVVPKKPQAIVKPNETGDPPPKPKVMDSAAVLRQKLQSGQMYLEGDWAALRKPGQAGIDEIRRIAEEERKKELAKTGGKPGGAADPGMQRSRLAPLNMDAQGTRALPPGHSKDDGHGH